MKRIIAGPEPGRVEWIKAGVAVGFAHGRKNVGPAQVLHGEPARGEQADGKYNEL